MKKCQYIAIAVILTLVAVVLAYKFVIKKKESQSGVIHSADKTQFGDAPTVPNR